MPLYTVLAPPPRTGQSAPDPVDFVFVKDGFCWPALFFGELWLLYRRLWLVLLLYIAVALGVSVAAAELGGPLPWIAFGLARLLFALEGNSLRRGKLRSRGYTFVGVAEGRRSTAEIRFFAEWQPPIPPAPAPEAPPPSVPPQREIRIAEAEPPKPADKPQAESGQVIGLFPSPGGAT